MFVSGTNPLSYALLPSAGYIYVSGVFLGVGILSSYYAL